MLLRRWRRRRWWQWWWWWSVLAAHVGRMDVLRMVEEFLYLCSALFQEQQDRVDERDDACNECQVDPETHLHSGKLESDLGED